MKKKFFHYRVIIFAPRVFFGYPLLARTIRCWSFSITLATVLMLVTVTTVPSVPPCDLNFDSHPSIKALCHHQIVESPNFTFPNAFFNNVVVSLSVFFKCTQNLITLCCSADTSIFFKYSASHCLAIQKCSMSYARFFFFLHINYCTHLLIRSRAFYRLRKSFFPSLSVHNYLPYGYVNMLSDN